ncbi:ligase-associated DNA damage response endonuclease PdeM [Shimia sp. MMG029]|uniref:ligase-associated DNA damage response endonuclease PdeM n=1 Tax=Shimia sp. MMG029 TaxID=3021978 RepID=UPI0022FEACD3|nr:ligase-associated DNA damage response endonuclease PdeM [Shimia sp. MMG029]MDA5558802.1 ligase-associated DNA damage response endonuclease PdeM [Shimia sp. MMG029]
MNGVALSFADCTLTALASGALWWQAQKLVVVSDLHLGKSERVRRRGGPSMPPYETRDTLLRLEHVLEETQPATVVCLGDSFDDAEAAKSLPEAERLWIARLQAGRRWIWIEGNHDPGPIDMGGEHLAELHLSPLIFRHIAQTGENGEISGHYHPKVALQTRLRKISRAAFLFDRDRIILPAFGTYTGGLRSDADVLSELMRPDAMAILTGKTPRLIPMPR